MEPFVLFLQLCILAGTVYSGRVKRQEFLQKQDIVEFADYQDVGLAFVTVNGKPSSGERYTAQYQNNGFGNHLFHNPPPPRPKKKEQNKIPGRAGIDYPTFHTVPQTNFKCSDTPAIPGMYANVETGCQAYHVCHDGRDGPQGASFLCTNGTLFNQKEFTCDWWYNVDCGLSLLYYGLNLDPLKNPYTKKEKEEELKKIHEYNHYNQQYH